MSQQQQSGTLTSQRNPDRVALRKVAVYRASRRTPLEVDDYVSSERELARYRQAGYEVSERLFTVYDPGAPKPPNTAELLALKFGSATPTTRLGLLPPGESVQALLAAARGWQLEARLGYVPAEPDPEQDTVPLEGFQLPGQNRYAYAADPGEAARLRARPGWVAQGSVANVMPIYTVRVSLRAEDGAVLLEPNVSNGVAGDPAGSFRVGRGRGNVIRFEQAPGSGDWTFSKISMQPEDGALRMLSFDAQQGAVFQDDDDGTQAASYEYSVVLRDASGKTYSHDPRIVNRVRGL